MQPVALITGAAKRIGAIIADTLHQAGYRVIIHYRHSRAEAESLADKFNQRQTHTAATIPADFNQPAALDNFVTQAQQIWGRLDVLVNNASNFFPTPVGETSEAQWDDLMNTNLKAPYFLSQAAAKYLSAHQGSIINITAIHGQRPLKGHLVYSTAEGGLIMLTKALARELAPSVRVNAIALGVTLLPEKKLTDAAIEQLREKTLLKRFASPQDVAEAVLFFTRQAAITGQILNIDGGRSLRQ